MGNSRFRHKLNARIYCKCRVNRSLRMLLKNLEIIMGMSRCCGKPCGRACCRQCCRSCCKPNNCKIKK